MHPEVLLINTPLDTTLGAQAEPSLPPLGLAYLATSAADAGFSVALDDAFNSGKSMEALISLLHETPASAIGMNVFSVNHGIVSALVAAVPEHKRVFLGGPAISSLLPEIERWPSARPVTVIIGEAEHAFPKALKGELAGTRSPAAAWLEKIVVSKGDPLFPDDIDLRLDREFVTGEPLYIPEHGLHEVHLIAGRGCPYDCQFCAGARSVRGDKVRRRSEHHIAAELANLIKRYPSATSARFLDDLPIRGESECDGIARLLSAVSLKWRAMMHVNVLAKLSDAALKRAAESGCVELFVGVESGDDEMLRKINKGHTSEKAASALQKALSAGINIKGYFIVGFPDETEEQVEATLNFARRMASFARSTTASFRTSAFAFRPYHGTPLYNTLLSSEKAIAAASADTALANLGDRRSFNITCGNFSNVSIDHVRSAVEELAGIGAGQQ